jgi:lipopolysaccharide export system protein LptA
MWRRARVSGAGLPALSLRDRTLRVLLLLCFTALPQAGQALDSDQEQPIRITADEALRDEKQGYTVYRGNVRMTQGTLRIEADAITIYHRSEEADRIVAEGRPARLQQQPEPDKGLVYARARIIEYYKLEERVLLREQAFIEQDGSTVTGETIDYLIRQQRVRADAGDSGPVEVVIPAQQLQRQQQDSERERGQTDGD